MVGVEGSLREEEACLVIFFGFLAKEAERPFDDGE